MIAKVAAAGRRAAAPMLSHDDSQPATRRFYRELGVAIAEFPMSTAIAREASAAGEAVVFGAPNVVRGGSHIGSLAAADMLAEGVCDVLASDYYYPAMLAAVARLVGEGRLPLARAWACVSANPAKASGLDDRGEIAPGKRADIVLVDWRESEAPAVRATLSGGRIAHLSGDLLR